MHCKSLQIKCQWADTNISTGSELFKTYKGTTIGHDCGH